MNLVCARQEMVCPDCGIGMIAGAVTGDKGYRKFHCPAGCGWFQQCPHRVRLLQTEDKNANNRAGTGGGSDGVREGVQRPGNAGEPAAEPDRRLNIFVDFVGNAHIRQFPLRFCHSLCIQA